MRLKIPILLAALPLAGCAAGGYPAVPDSTPPPFDAYEAGARLAPGMPVDVAIMRIGWAPISGRTTTCGVLAAEENPCQALTFGRYDNNRLVVYVVPAGDGSSVVSSWMVHKG
jgi:hypothetical protein